MTPGVSCQLCLYPLGQADLGSAIDAALSALSARGLSFEPCPMSTIVRGPLEEVPAALCTWIPLGTSGVADTRRSRIRDA